MRGRSACSMHWTGAPVRRLGSSVSVGIRPEKLTLSHEKPHEANTIAGTVSAKAYFGDRSHYYVSVPGAERLIAVAHQNVARSLAEEEERR